MIKEKSVSNKVLYSDIREVLNRRLYHFPKRIRPIIIEEMCKVRILKKINKTIYELNTSVAELHIKKAKITIE